MKKKTELVTVPNFVFDQLDTDGIVEASIHVKYYNGSIELSQGDNSILIEENSMWHLCKEIQRHYSEAKRFLDRKQ